MFDEVLIESAGTDRQKGGWITAAISAAIHVGIVGAIVAAGMYVEENPHVIEKPMSAFVAGAAAPPPPPPPPAAGGSVTRANAQRVEREPSQPEPFRQPDAVPQLVPVIADVPHDEDDGAMEGGMEGGVIGGQTGGVVGGHLDGKAGGIVGGIPGANGVIPGGTGVTPGGTGIIDTPLPVGGNVKAPVAVSRVDPVYTEAARRARVRGFAIVEATIDRQGNVIEARIVKPLPMGLDAAALNAVRQWKFRPGTLNGQPVPVIFNLTVNFQLN